MITAPDNATLDPLADLVGCHTGLARVADDVRRLLGVPVNVLVQGESGTGKELVARALHDADPQRSARPLVALNCAALPESLIESELFGHCRGAFTGATADREGAFAAAGGGTLFLDEVGELPLALQPKLLRVLQEKTYRPVGTCRERPADVRVVAASNRDLEAAVEEGAFRPDLYFRLAEYVVRVPPLRERRQDILPLANHFLRQYRREYRRPAVGRLAPAAEAWLLGQDWATSNVRELSVALKRGVLRCDGGDLTVAHLCEDRPPTVAPASAPTPAPARFPATQRAGLDRAALAAALERTGGNLAAAARLLDMSRSTLFDWTRRAGLRP